jgi:hypothetical protein
MVPAASVVPFAEDAMQDQVSLGAPLCCQVTPELVEVKMGPLVAGPGPGFVVSVAPTTATNLFPSAEEATAVKLLFGTLFDTQSTPAFVEV